MGIPGLENTESLPRVNMVNGELLRVEVGRGTKN